jgi:AcrR family transcriptional regulator
MSPRPYRLGKRQESIEETRARILDAARELLMAGDGFAGFTIDAVARQAGVARMTVYYQFSSKVGLLEALSDDLAVRGQIHRLAEVFAQAEPLDVLDSYITTFARFWGTDRLATRRLRALATLDTDFEQVVQARDERRRMVLSAVLRRLREQLGRPDDAAFDATFDLLYTLTSFESFDSLAGPMRTPEEVVPLVSRLARLILGVDTAASASPDTS